jgi:hypothetical protein
MSAALLTLGERAASGLGKGGLFQVFVEGAHGYVVLMSAGDSAVLVTVTSKNAKVGLVLFEMRRTAARISSVMLESSFAPEPPVADAKAVVESEQGPPIWGSGEPSSIEFQPQESAWDTAINAPVEAESVTGWQ